MQEKPEVMHSQEAKPTNHSPFFAPVMEPALSTGTEAAYGVPTARLDKG